MDFEKVLWELETLGIRKNCRIILKTIFENGGLTADEICSNTSIPKGRVYDYLNELMEKNLLLKKKGHPSLYYFDSFENRAVEYSIASLYRELERQKKLLKKMNLKESLVPINNMSDYVLLRAREKFNADKLGFILRDGSYHSFFFPNNSIEEYLSFRKRMGIFAKPKISSITDMRNLALNLRTSKRVVDDSTPLKSIIGKESFDRYAKNVGEFFGKQELEKRLNKIIETLEKNKNIKMRIVDERFSYSLVLTEKSLMFTITETMPEESFINGFLLRNKKDVKKYWSILNTRFEKGKNFKKAVEKKLEEKDYGI